AVCVAVGESLGRSWEWGRGRGGSSFFESGGASISAMRLVSRLRQRGVSASVRDVFESSSAMSLSRTLWSRSGEAADSAIDVDVESSIVAPAHRVVADIDSDSDH
ncbi:phosphopantetheine-binding protein, partial [Klebsiella pneumoniae]|uniref:phosphopantetheine-binding protein n=1 Tax=Klebsiella pneumoniae TaxID=573 RepID=UPI003A80D027